MRVESSEAFLAAYDGAPLNGRYWTTYAILAVAIAFDYFDFMIVGFLIAMVGPQWHPTYGQSSLIRLTGRIGGIVGALVFTFLAPEMYGVPISHGDGEPAMALSAAGFGEALLDKPRSRRLL